MRLFGSTLLLVSSVFALAACDLKIDSPATKPAATYTGVWEEATGTQLSVRDSGQNFYRRVAIDPNDSVRVETSHAYASDLPIVGSTSLNTYNYGTIVKNDSAATVSLSNEMHDKANQARVDRPSVSMNLISENLMTWSENGKAPVSFTKTDQATSDAHLRVFVDLLYDLSSAHGKFVHHYGARKLILVARRLVTRNLQGAVLNVVSTPGEQIADYTQTGPTTIVLNPKRLLVNSPTGILVNNSKQLEFMSAIDPASNKGLVVTVIDRTLPNTTVVVMSGLVQEVDDFHVTFAGPDLHVGATATMPQTIQQTFYDYGFEQ